MKEKRKKNGIKRTEKKEEIRNKELGEKYSFFTSSILL